jgi:hypothetical protein
MARTIEVDEAEWNQRQALAAVAGKMVGNPSARKLLEQAHKLVDPNAATPALDAERAQNEPINAIKTELSEEIAALKKEREDEKRQRTLDSLAQKQTEGIQRLRRSGYTDEGVAAVQKLMEDKGILDVDDAVAIFERHNPPQVPATPGGMNAWNYAANIESDTDKGIQNLLKTKGENDQVVMGLAMEALNEFRGARR